VSYRVRKDIGSVKGAQEFGILFLEAAVPVVCEFEGWCSKRCGLGCWQFVALVSIYWLRLELEVAQGVRAIDCML